MDKIFRVNMSNLTCQVEEVPEAWAGLGGRGLTSTIVAAEVPPTCHPLGPNNKLVFAPGLLSGTAAANSGRMSCGAKSPLTGTIKESNAGGTSAQQFARMGIKALIIEGQPQEDKWYNLHLTKDGATLQEEKELLGKGNFEVVDAVEARFNKKTGLITIGPAGENQLIRQREASISSPPTRLSTRSTPSAFSTVTVAPNRTRSPARSFWSRGSTMSAASSCLVRKRILRSISRRRLLPY